MRLPRTLDAVEIRILGALLEKAQTTPDNYPLTVNALLAACNQKSNRDPVTRITETEVWDALDRLRQDVLVWRHEGARAERFSESISRRLELRPATRALMTLLLLRGPQTPGELRSRSERMRPFASLTEVEEALAELATGVEPLVVELGRRPGQKEARWGHLLGGPVETEPTAPTPAPAVTTAAPEPPARPAGPALSDRVTTLEQAVAELRDELRALKHSLGED